MVACRHPELEFVGEQRTDDGVNSYRRCKVCGTLLVMTPGGKLIGIPGVKSSQSASSMQKGTS